MKERIESGFLAAGGGVILLVLFLCLGCGQETTFSPDSPELTASSSTGESIPPSEGSSPTVEPSEPSGCEIIRLKRAGVEVDTHCEKGVRFYVPADPTKGKGYFNVWLPAVNDGKKLGPFAYYEWTKWIPMEPGTYEWALAAETKMEDGTVHQCDWHKREFVIPTCKVDPECPPQSHFDIVVTQASQPTEVPDNCPDFENFAYTVATNLPVIDLNLPSGCTSSTPTSGTCQFPVEKETYQIAISGSGKTLDGLLCGSDFETRIIEGCECILPSPPECPFGPPTPHPVVCSWVCPPCVQPEPPECTFGEAIWNEKACDWYCPACILPPPPECPFGEAIRNDELCIWECPPCVMPPPPECPFGDPIEDKVVCDWVCPPCEVICDPGFHLHPETCDCWCDPTPPECPEQITWDEETCSYIEECLCVPQEPPECQEQIWNEELCIWEGECLCEYGYVEPGCYEGNVDTAQHLYDNHGVCMTRILHEGEKENACWLAAISTDLVVVKAGSSYKIFLDVFAGQLLCSCTYPNRPQHDISHISYFMCDESAICGVIQ